MSAVQSCLPDSSKWMLTLLPFASILVGTATQVELPQLVIEKDSPRSIHTGTGGPDGTEPFRLSGTPWYVSSATLAGPPPHAAKNPAAAEAATTLNTRIPNYFTNHKRQAAETNSHTVLLLANLSTGANNTTLEHFRSSGSLPPGSPVQVAVPSLMPLIIPVP